MNSSNTKANLLICSLMFLLLSCAPVNVKYLKPIGDGALFKSSTCGGPKDQLKFTPDSGVDLYVWGYPKDIPDSFSMNILIQLQKDVSFQFVSPQITLKSSEYSKDEKVDIDSIVAYSTGQTYLPTDKLVGYTYEERSFFGKADIPEYFKTSFIVNKGASKHFELKLPAVKIRGTEIDIQPIAFELKEEVFIVPFLCP